MFQIIRTLFNSGDTQGGTVDQRCDPLSHPAIRRMTPDELADLPLGRIADNRNSPCSEVVKRYA